MLEQTKNETLLVEAKRHKRWASACSAVWPQSLLAVITVLSEMSYR